MGETYHEVALGVAELEDADLELTVVVGGAAVGSAAVGLQVVGGSLGHGDGGGGEAKSSSSPLHDGCEFVSERPCNVGCGF